MPVFTILVILAAILLWLLLSPLFSKIGGSVIRKIRNIFQSEERKENEDVEKKRKGLSDFAVASESMGPISLGLAFAASFFSAATFLGYVGYAYAWGLPLYGYF